MNTLKIMTTLFTVALLQSTQLYANDQGGAGLGTEGIQLTNVSSNESDSCCPCSMSKNTAEVKEVLKKSPREWVGRDR